VSECFHYREGANFWFINMESLALIQLVPYIIALSTGFITISSTIFLYIRHRGKVYFYFSLLSFAMLSKLLHLIVKFHYTISPPVNEQAMLVVKITKAFGLSLLLLVLPVLVNHVLLLKFDLYKMIVFVSISVSAFIIYLFDIIFKDIFPYHYFITNAFFVFVAIYCIGAIILNFKRITDIRLKIIISTFLVLAIVFFPLLVTDIINMETTLQLPVFFIIINTLSIIFCLFYLSSPAIIKEEQPGDYYREKYNITNREKEIIDLIRMGYSNREIGTMKHISISTVEKHIYSIYKKLNVSNRVQLINVIQSDLQSR
jgi:DNA-binding CsgD family transcriptional regulator